MILLLNWTVRQKSKQNNKTQNKSRILRLYLAPRPVLWMIQWSTNLCEAKSQELRDLRYCTANKNPEIQPTEIEKVHKTSSSNPGKKGVGRE